MGLLNFRKCLFLTLKNDFLAENIEKILKLASQKLDNGSSILLETVKTFEISRFDRYND